MHISPLRKNIPLTVVTLAALGIMFFLFFMHPAPPEESLEFYAPDGNIAGSFRVEITNAPSNPAYTEVKIIPEDMESFQRFLAQFRIGGVGRRIRDFHPEGTRDIAVRRKEFQ